MKEQKSRTNSPHNRKATLKKVERRFQPVLEEFFGKPAFILARETTAIIPDTRTTVVLFLSRFIDMFADLIENEDYSITSYIRRNEELDLKIDNSVFVEWKEKGCLSD